MQAVHVPCPSCGLGLEISGVDTLSCAACGGVTPVAKALRSELAASRERLSELATADAQARVREQMVQAHRLGWRHALLLLWPFVGTGLVVGLAQWRPELYGWVCALVAVPYLVWAFLWLRRSRREMLAGATVETITPKRVRRCSTCGAPTPVGVVAGAPCASCDTPLLAVEEDRAEAIVVEVRRVEANAARVASLERRLQARIDRHRYVDFAPWSAFMLCFGFMPIVGTPAVVLGYLAGNFGLAELAGVLAFFAALAVGLSIWPLWRWRRVQRFLAGLDALRGEGARASREPGPLLDWLDANWPAVAPPLPPNLFAQGRCWGTVCSDRRALVLNLDAVYRQHPCQPAAWLLALDRGPPPPGSWRVRDLGGYVIYALSSDAVKPLRRSDWVAAARAWVLTSSGGS